MPVGGPCHNPNQVSTAKESPSSDAPEANTNIRLTKSKHYKWLFKAIFILLPWLVAVAKWRSCNSNHFYCGRDFIRSRSLDQGYRRHASLEWLQ